MNTYLPPFVCDDDIPEIVRQRIHLLYAKEAHMRMVEAQMKTLREEIDLLHVELSRYSVRDDGEDGDQDQASHRPVRYAKRGAPIHQCPDEILGMIFSQYLYYEHMHIWTLLFVCKRWNHLIMNSPILWACIEISDGRTLFDIPAHSSKQVYTYIAACLKRSNELPIDVKLNLYNIPDCERDWVREVIAETPICNSTVLDSLLDEADRYGDWGTEDYNDEVRRVFTRFTSPQGAHPERWATLLIGTQEDTDFSLDIWSYFLPVAPRLNAVSMNDYPDEWTEDEGSDITMPEISTARSLSLPYDISLHYFKVSPTHLRHLEIGIASEDRALKGLSLFPLLETLIIHTIFYEHNPDVIPFRIHLPLLKDLCFSGNYAILKLFDLDFPNLSTLSLNNVSRKWFKLDSSPLYLQWGNVDPSDAKYCEPLLCDFLPRFPTVQVSTLPHYAKETALATIREWKADGKIPNFRQLQLEDSEGNIECHDVSN